MNHPYAKKIPRHHPQVQDRTMSVDGFTDFAYKAFDPKYDKSAAPLSKRRNGIGPINHQLGNIVIGESAMATRFIIAAGGIALVTAYSSKISKVSKSATKETKMLLNRAGRKGVLAAATVLAFIYN